MSTWNKNSLYYGQHIHNDAKNRNKVRLHFLLVDVLWGIWLKSYFTSLSFSSFPALALFLEHNNYRKQLLP